MGRYLTMTVFYMKFAAAPTFHGQDGLTRQLVTFGLNLNSVQHAIITKTLGRQKIFAVNMVEGSVPRLSLKLLALVEQVVITTVTLSGLLRLMSQQRHLRLLRLRHLYQVLLPLSIGLFVVELVVALLKSRYLTMTVFYMKFAAAPTFNSQDGLTRQLVTYGQSQFG